MGVVLVVVVVKWVERGRGVLHCDFFYGLVCIFFLERYTIALELFFFYDSTLILFLFFSMGLFLCAVVIEDSVGGATLWFYV